MIDRRLEKDIKGLNDKIRTEAQHMLDNIDVISSDVMGRDVILEAKNSRKSVKSPLALKIIENNKLMFS